MMNLTGAPDNARLRWPMAIWVAPRVLSSQEDGEFFVYTDALLRQVGWYREKREARPEGALLFLFSKNGGQYGTSIQF